MYFRVEFGFKAESSLLNSLSRELLWLEVARNLGSLHSIPTSPKWKMEYHVLAVGKNRCGRAGMGLRDASHGPSLMWIFGVRFEDWL